MSESLSDFTGKINGDSAVINGVEFKTKEFDMRTRALWLDVAEEFGLSDAQFEIQSKVIPKISGISNDIQSDPRIQSVQSKAQKLQLQHDDLMELYATPEEPEDIDEQLEKVVSRMEQQQEEIARITQEVQSEIFDEAKHAEKAVADFMELQDRARVNFVWRLAKAAGKTEQDFDDFYNSCNGDDYEAAERFVERGNVRWASLYSNRMQKKPSSKGLN